MENSQDHAIVYYLQYTSKLPWDYFSLARELNGLGITLLAISPMDFVKLSDARKRFVLSHCHSMESQREFLKWQKKIIAFAQNAGRIFHIHLTSFGPLNLNNTQKKSNNYFYVGLPVELDRMGKLVSMLYYKGTKEEKRNWPGGRRPRLPQGILIK